MEVVELGSIQLHPEAAVNNQHNRHEEQNIDHRPKRVERCIDDLFD